MDDESRKRAEANLLLGRTYYQVLTDAAGYPNGMPFWGDMSPADKYYYCATAINFLETTASVPRDEFRDAGFSRESRWGTGDCKALMDLLEERGPEEKRELEERIAEVRKAYKNS